VCIASDAGGYWKGKRVLELGAGSGHLAVGLANLGAAVVATESAESELPTSGFDQMVAWTTHLQGTRAAEGGVKFRSLHWSAEVDPAAWRGFDVVILSELYYDPDLHEVLLQTLRSVLHPGMRAFSVFCDRPFSLGFLAMLDDDGTFGSTPLEPDELFSLHEDEILYMHEITRLPEAEAEAVAPAGPAPT